jgi:hypothetical protein
MAATAFYTDSLLDDVMRANVTPSADTFKMMMLTSAAAPSKSAWAKRSDVTNEISGTGYTAGGVAVAVTLTAASGNSDLELTNIADGVWTSATITARYAIVYKSRGGAASADNLFCIIDFGADFTSTNGTFTVHMSVQPGVQN